MPEKVFIGSNDLATFRCPKCDKAKTANVSRYKNIQTAVRVKAKCPCGHTFTVVLERRKHVRKNLNLPGTYVVERTGHRGAMNVRDLSRSGVKIKLNFRPDFEIGDRLVLEFNLDDNQRSIIRKEIIVRSIKDLYVGTEFSNIDHYDKLGSYLLFDFNS